MLLRALLKSKLGKFIRTSNCKMRDCQDVPRFLKKLDKIEKRSEKSKLMFD